MPEPSWTRIGTQSLDDKAQFYHNGDIYTFGRSDLYVEMYKVENDNSIEETNYACIPHLKQWPGRKLDNAVPANNWHSVLTQDWSKNEYGSLEITDWGPESPKMGSIDWSMGLQVGTSGAGGSISASYSTPYIQRKVNSEYNRTVSHKYNYPSSLDPFDAEAKKQIVGIENAGEVWLSDSGGYYDALLDARVSSTFEYAGILSSLNIDMEVSKWLLE